ncbi:MAG: RNA polymerase sigma factor [Saprospiraceae bacterium]|jgi:RNA polymerase sigma factor (sigma-70 family)|nr:RNA polymerase sigma factor [Saprospiraceae bacterium]MBK7697767.1 RNA polymerase sigma factor [Saprospiraceae bacterium]MBK8827266.1 RNA polymerase sigma factor [Saprospiraceae bacterium]MBK9581057.1 RNA polymerase sigma factor [Saprospiraceae bacterium]MBK9742174.1 RNA polymerase sigma factor [Saprospiraceae bacterium]
MDITLQILNPEESDFLNACINNERWAQKKLYEDNYASMMSLSMRYANNNDDALDILHESFIKIFRNLHKYQSGTSIAAWIRKIVINTAIDFYRRDLKRKSEDLNEANYITTGIPDAISTISSEEILKALQQLPHSYRSVFNLHVIEGYSHKEIAEMLNINESTCRSNLVKARTKLKNILLAADSDLR